LIWAQIVEVWINLAHVAALQSEHSVAIYIYQQTLQRFSARMPLDQRIDVHISLARELAIAEKYLECIRTLVKAAHLKPLSDPLWHNVAQMQRMFAHKTLEEAKDVLEKDLYDPTTLVERPGMAVRFARALCACARARVLQ
jgi:predicted nucleotidyltransferase component of viral defense system